MRFVEGEGGTIDEAIAQALQALGATRDQVEIDILENAVRGLLGFGRRRARVRATVRAPLVWQDVEVVRSGAVTDGARHDAPPPAARERSRDASPGREPRRDAAAPRPPQAASEPRPTVARVAPEGFDAAGLVTEVLRMMGWTAAVRLAADGDPQILEITSGDPAVAAACSDEVLRALGFLVSRIAERQGRDGRRFEVTLGSGAHGARPPVPRAPERARSHSRERRGGGRPRR